MDFRLAFLGVLGFLQGATWISGMIFARGLVVRVFMDFRGLRGLSLREGVPRRVA